MKTRGKIGSGGGLIGGWFSLGSLGLPAGLSLIHVLLLLGILRFFSIHSTASKQGSSSLTRIDSNKRSSSSDPEDAQIVYLKDNVTIHPTQYATERISGRLKFDQTSWSKTSLNYWDTVFINLPKLEKR
ncbi:unnamed protein product [Lactuca saligna]|uniref:Uncharacterized protein n=1 Tax=Lactuca saligna TaxID=75948 RepID=A0AA35XZ30_LACSI|nr:unnamed protein product [Lactuca saligna]